MTEELDSEIIKNNQDKMKQERSDISAKKQSYDSEKKIIQKTAKNPKAYTKENTEEANVKKVRKIVSEESLESYEHLYANPRYEFSKV